MADDNITFIISIDGKQQQVCAAPKFVEALNSNDPLIRHQAYEMVARDLGLSASSAINPHSKDTEQSTSTCVDENIGEDDNNNNIPCQADPKAPKLWKAEEETMLINIRLAKDTLFSSAKNHDVLWDKITKELNKNGIKGSKVQVANKWKSLKKKYKEVIDANNKTGNERVDWKYFDMFHEAYGHKASTGPVFTMDTSKKSNENEQGETEKKTTRVCGKKRKSNSTDKVISVINESNEKLLSEIKTQHDAKMARMDRFLNIFENAVVGKIGKKD